MATYHFNAQHQPFPQPTRIYMANTHKNSGKAKPSPEPWAQNQNPTADNDGSELQVGETPQSSRTSKEGHNS